MNIAFCYESVLPARGGCETYISDLARRLVADRHEVHLYACRWDASALPEAMHFHAIEPVTGPRFLRPWRFGRRCLDALARQSHDVSIGFDKTWGQDVLYPQGGLHAASVEHNFRKHSSKFARGVARAVKWFDLAHWSFAKLERKQYLGPKSPLVVVNSNMVRDHFLRYLHVPPGQLRVVRSAIDPDRFPERDRFKCRLAWRQQHGIDPGETVGLFAGMNYHLKGLEPLLYSVQKLLARPEYRDAPPSFRLAVVGSPATKNWERLATRLGVRDRVLFVGHCAEMRSAYFASDFLVHPTFYDPCSLVVLEALACGLPIITTRCNGASELLKPIQEGYVVDDPHDHQQMAWCLSQMLDPGRRHSCAQAARRAATHWTFEQHYRQLLSVFVEVLLRKQAA
jgi:UDP-glucose:(heptosyl)LPS alpha-1,3-glucosyltransferase